MRIALACVSAGLFACGGSSSSTPSAIEIDFSATGVSPGAVNVVSGGQVRFVNKDTAAHQVSSSACPELNSPSLAASQSFSVTLSGTKQCPFVDALNPSVTSFQGTVNVAPAGSPGY